MKNFKKILSLLIAFSMTVSMVVPAFADDVEDAQRVVEINQEAEVDETIQDNDLANLVKGFLEDTTYNVYMGEDRDIESILPDEAEAAEVEQDLAVAQRSRAVTVPEGFTVDTELSQFIDDKSAYISFIAEEEDIVRENFETEYTIENIEIMGDYAVVDVFETIGFQYADYDQPSAISTRYQISVVNTEDGWVVADMQSNDEFDEVYRADDFDLEEEMEVYEADKAELEESLVLGASADASALIEPASGIVAASAATSPTIPYKGTNAANYARNYTTTTGVNSQSYYNKNFANYNGVGGDCMNFAAQAMWAGFGGNDDLVAIRAKKVPMDATGSYTLWSTNTIGGATSSWTSNSGFYTYMVNTQKETNGNSISDDIYTVAPSASFVGIYNYSTRLVGAIVSGNGGGGSYSHASVIVDVRGPTRSQVYVCAHNNDRKNVKMSDMFSSGNVRIFVPSGFNIRGSEANLIRVTNNMLDCQPVGSTLNLTANASEKAFRMSMQVITPSGQTLWLGEKTNTSSYSASYRFNERGLYRIKSFARDKDPNISGSYSGESAYHLRIY